MNTETLTRRPTNPPPHVHTYTSFLIQHNIRVSRLATICLPQSTVSQHVTIFVHGEVLMSFYKVNDSNYVRLKLLMAFVVWSYNMSKPPPPQKKELSVEFPMHGNLERSQERKRKCYTLTSLVIILNSLLIVLIRVYRIILAHGTQTESQSHFAFISQFQRTCC